jgi:hypothetical protein
MRIASSIIREDVKDSVFRTSEVDGKPRGRRRLLLDQRQGRFEKILNLFVQAGFNF